MTRESTPGSLSIIVPFLNEADSIPLFLQRLEQVMAGQSMEWEVIFIDDGSHDAT